MTAPAPDDLSLDPLKSFTSRPERTPSPDTVTVQFGMPAEPEATLTRIFHKPDARYSPDNIPPTAAGYRLLRPIAQGGSGEIWEAVQLSLERIVAVKRLRKNTFVDEGGKQNRRMQEVYFRQEALTASALEHPNILPIHDCGYDEEGTPLLVMKLVRGRLWSDLIGDEFAKLSPTEFLARHVQILATVANAVAFAHSRGVVHRDLKPSQVMIGDFAEVQLMDWGLAMAWDPQSTSAIPTAGPREESPLWNPINPAGTPTFMAPEQTVEDTSGLGPWTDVFLLGGILYLLLTGRAPFWTASGKDSFRLASECDFAHPYDAAPPQRDLPSALVGLALQALSADRDMRPPSASDFRQALVDWLSGASRSAESEALCRSVSLFLATTSADSADYAPLATQLNELERAAILWPDNPAVQPLRESVLQRYARSALAQRDLRLARVQAERLSDGDVRSEILAEVFRCERELDQQAELLRASLEATESARQRSETLRGHAERLVRFLLRDLYHPLKSIGRLDLLRSAVQEAQRYFDSPAVRDTSDAETLYNRAVALMNIGDILSDEGNKRAARESYENATTTLTSVAELFETRPEWRADFARALDRLGTLLYYIGQVEEARNKHQKALELREAIGLEGKEDRIEYASCMSRIAITYWRLGDMTMAGRFHLQALAHLRAVEAAHGTDDQVAAALAFTLFGLSNVHRDTGRLDEAVTANEEALAHREAICRTDPSNIAAMEDMMLTRSNLGTIYLNQGRIEEAVRCFAADGLASLRHSAERHSSIARLQAVSFPMSMAAETTLLLGDEAAADKAFQDALQVARRLAARDASVHFQAVLGNIAARTAEICLLRGRAGEARILAAEAETVCRIAITSTPKNQFFCKAMARALHINGLFLAGEGQPEEGRQRFDEAATMLADLQEMGDHMLAELQAQNILFRGDRQRADEIAEYLRKRRWLTPYLAFLLRHWPDILPAAREPRNA